MPTTALNGQKIAFLVANEGIEQIELTRPWEAVEHSAATPRLIAPKSGSAQGFNHLDRADTFDVDETTQAADPADYDALVLPGGVANADQIRTDEHAVRFVRAMFDAGKPVGVICHGPWILVEADVVRGRTLTSWPSVQTDLRNAGATWVDEQVYVCTGGPNTIISSRKPDDLDAFCSEIVKRFAEARLAISRR
jgi:protease I